MVVVKQLNLQMKVNREKDELTPEEWKEYQTVLQTMTSLSEAVRWDSDKHKVRLLLQSYDVSFLTLPKTFS